MNLHRSARKLVTAALLASGLAACAPLPTPPASAPPPPAPGRPVAPAPGRPVAPAPAPAPPAGPLVLEGEPLITVGLAWDLDSLTLAPVEGFTAGKMAWAGGRAAPGRGTARFRPAGDGVRVESPRGTGWETSFTAGVAETTWLLPHDLKALSTQWKGRQWRGALGVFRNPRGKLTLVTRLPLETYLLGVVPGEIGALGEDRIEAGRAQAIAARSYTLFYVGRRAAEGFDLYGTVEDQVYGPLESERAIATRCVEETRGQVALAGGRPIRANYCSTCGGITADVWEAWPAPPLAYLVSHRDRAHGEDYCAASAHYRWRETWTADEFMANLARFGPPNNLVFPARGLGDLVDVAVEARSRSGRVWRLGVTTTTGTVVVPAYVVRQVLRRGGQPAAILRSNLFKIGVRRDPATRAVTAVVASGAGSGHGVGLCQTGALGMALAGQKARAILEHYYPGAEVRALYR